MNKVCKLLERYIEGTLSEEKEVLFENHLKYCLNCKREVELYRKVEDNLNLIPSVKVPDVFKDLVMERVREYRKKLIGWSIYGSAVTIFLLLSFIGIYFIGVSKVISSFYFLSKSLCDFAQSFGLAVFTISASLYNCFGVGRFNWLIYLFLFSILSFVFVRSVKSFSKEVR